MFDFWKEELSAEREEHLLDHAANAIERRKLAVPAILALEMHKPLAHVGASAAVAFAPFLVPFFGFDAVNDYTQLLSTRQNVERLLQRIERKPEEAA